MFTADVNGTGFWNKQRIDSVFTFSQSPGSDYFGSWDMPNQFTMMIGNTTGTIVTQCHLSL
jgi:hypothetical protein